MDDHENIDINDNSSDANTANYNQDKNGNTSEVNDYSKEDIEGDENLKSSKGKQENNTKSSSDKDENTIDYGNHDFPCNPAPPVPIKLFIGRVPKNIEEDQLRPIFEEYGIVNEVVIIRDKITNVHKSSAFVKMASISEADNAIRLLNNQKTLDAQLGSLQVKYASGELNKLGFPQNIESGVDQAKLFIGSLPKNITEDNIKEMFSPYGTVEEVFIMKDNSTGLGKGCSFVKFSYKEQALYAIKSLNGKKTLEGCTRPVEVRFAEPKSSKQPQIPLTLQPMQNPPHAMAPQPSISSPNNINFGNNFSVNNNYPRQVGPWKEYYSGEGRPYYYNEQTNTTQWEMPKEFETLFMNNSANMHNLSESSGPPGANLFIFHVPNEWQQTDLIQAFSPFGELLSARIATEKNTGRNRGFAFVSYDSLESAAAAISQMNGFMALNKKLKVTVKKGEEDEMKKYVNQNGVNSFQQVPRVQKAIPAQPASMQPNLAYHQNAQAQNFFYSNSNSYRCGPY
ncbi:CUGBP Elav-like family member 1 [Plasmodium reichenowi]|uniref:CUGBP Elav-like family member 1 n=1 Tax=Plasmodium reichenowi TaxID=5854 RepID=A0A060RY15_PLARE|nr:rRNA associated RNA binding protein, putative [Plasmodium reichenowi]KYN95010.1 rRNA associated RNA binding protein, putative [Plasmodium reichenowi]CDO66375.1 rRNA associated RNA binding protein, putative [Plasmodium reichenowi]SOV82219.1 CUGBP Elav-like family member 1 [Plasmodium reichenowi]